MKKIILNITIVAVSALFVTVVAWAVFTRSAPARYQVGYNEGYAYGKAYADGYANGYEDGYRDGQGAVILK